MHEKCRICGQEKVGDIGVFSYFKAEFSMMPGPHGLHLHAEFTFNGTEEVFFCHECVWAAKRRSANRTSIFLLVAGILLILPDFQPGALAAGVLLMVWAEWRLLWVQLKRVRPTPPEKLQGFRDRLAIKMREQENRKIEALRKAAQTHPQARDAYESVLHRARYGRDYHYRPGRTQEPHPAHEWWRVTQRFKK